MRHLRYSFETAQIITNMPFNPFPTHIVKNIQNLTSKQLIVHIPKITTAAPSPPQYIQVLGLAYLSFYTGALQLPAHPRPTFVLTFPHPLPSTGSYPPLPLLERTSLPHCKLAQIKIDQNIQIHRHILMKVLIDAEYVLTNNVLFCLICRHNRHGTKRPYTMNPHLN